MTKLNLYGIRRKLLEFVYLMEVGRNKVANRIYGYVPEVLMVFTFLKVYGIEIKLQWVLLITISMAASFYIAGLLYDRLYLNHIEAEIVNDRNPTIRKLDEILEQVRK